MAPTTALRAAFVFAWLAVASAEGAGANSGSFGFAADGATDSVYLLPRVPERTRKTGVMESPAGVVGSGLFCGAVVDAFFELVLPQAGLVNRIKQMVCREAPHDAGAQREESSSDGDGLAQSLLRIVLAGLVALGLRYGVRRGRNLRSASEQMQLSVTEASSSEEADTATSVGTSQSATSSSTTPRASLTPRSPRKSPRRMSRKTIREERKAGRQTNVDQDSDSGESSASGSLLDIETPRSMRRSTSSVSTSSHKIREDYQLTGLVPWGQGLVQQRKEWFEEKDSEEAQRPQQTTLEKLSTIAVARQVSVSRPTAEQIDQFTASGGAGAFLGA